MRQQAKRMGKCMVIVLMMVLLVLPTVAEAAVVPLKEGSRGQKVEQLQTKLKRWGYYTGVVDGVFGGGTREAVMYFQRKNGLTADGVVGAKTAAAVGMSLETTSGGGGNTAKTTENDVYLMARAIYGEARGEPYTGQVAVGAVIMNRVRNASFPNTIAGVIYQPGAFDAVKDGQINLTPNAQCISAARDAMGGYDPTTGAIYYYNPQTATNKWIRTRPIVLTIGKHVFAK